MEEDMESTSPVNQFVIKATNVPAEFLVDRDKAKRYFRRFGRVKLVMFRPRKQCLFIEYTNEDSMLNALEVAGEYKGHLFTVTRDTETVIKKKKPKKEKDPDWTSDPEIKSELEAMGAFGPTRTYDLRQEPMIVDTEVSKLTMKQRKWRAASASPKPIKRKTVKDSVSAEHSELLRIIEQQAFNVEDRYRILDARDKLIRLKLKKNVEISKAKATVGTCPDMCPEKERVMRETQHQVALYEQEESGKGIMNPRLAVKQYSRSSADQEAPLPQDLRPVSVLQMTMGYLMHRIIGLCENSDVNIAEWYHFLWDRTRGIRKDITQQELCCQGSVELVEQCARFHIFCSARLVSEDPSVFDQKINTENLTKCLQTLKYMYHDLELKGESCKNEPEFRAYIILLNLNDGNFMWEVQQLREEIQQSKEVRFALEVYSSLDKQNYVKFFKLVNSTTFLNACILMRYFIQVRIVAVKTLLKSYAPRVSQSSLPVHYLTKILAFENIESTIEFFESYGLFTDTSRTRIVLNKISFSPPDYPYVLDRAKNLVESKCEKSTGEIICGRELPPKIYECHIPQNSFDQNGFLKIPSELIEIEPIKPIEKKDEPLNLFEKKEEQVNLVEMKDEPVKIFEKKDQPFKMFDKKEENSVFGRPIPVQKTSIFGTKQSEPNINIFGPPKTETMKMTWTSPSTTKHNIFSGITITSPSNSISTEEITPILPIEKPEETSIEQPKEDENETKQIQDEIRRKKEEEEKKEAERRRKLDEERKEAKKREELRLKTLKEEEEKRRLEEIARRKKLEEEQRLEQERRKNNEITNSINNLINDLLEDVEENVKISKLNEIRKTKEIRRAQKVLLKWKEHTRRKRKRKALDFSPLWLGGKTSREEAEELLTKSQVLALQSMKRYKRGKPIEIELNKDKDISKIDLSELTYKSLTKRIMDVEMKLQNELFWKVTISLPNESEYNCGLNHIEKILDNYIKWEKRGNTTMVIEQSKLIPTVTYCLEKQKGLIINNKNDTNGFIFLANNINDNLSTRIVQNFKKFGSYVKVPIVLLLQNYVENQSNIKSLISNEMISDYLILVDKFTSKNLINLIEEALIFLSTRVEKSPPLEMDTLKSFLTKYLCDDLGRRIISFAKWNCNYKDCLKYPNTVIYLYNQAISRLKNVLVSKRCHEYQKFPEVFKDFLRSQIPDTLPCDYKYFPDFWNNPTYIKHIETLLDRLKLPNLLEDWPPKNQKKLEVGILKYCSKLSKEPRKCFYKIMGILLKGINPIINFEDVGNIVWTDIVELLVTEKLLKTDFSLYGTGFVSKSVFNQLVVVYDINMLNDYVDSDWFYVDNPIIKLKIQEVLNKPKERNEVEPKHIDIEDIDLDKIMENLKKPRNFDISKLKHEISECRMAVEDLEETTAIQKKMFETTTNILQHLLDDK